MGAGGGGGACQRAANGRAPWRREEGGRAGHAGAGQRGAAAQVGAGEEGGGRGSPGGLATAGEAQGAPGVPGGWREPRGASMLPAERPVPAPGLPPAAPRSEGSAETPRLCSHPPSLRG